MSTYQVLDICLRAPSLVTGQRGDRQGCADDQDLYYAWSAVDQSLARLERLLSQRAARGK